MKHLNKLPLLILVPVAFGTLIGCNKNQTTKYEVTYGTYARETVKEIDYDDLKNKINSTKENFLLAVYPQAGCDCWSTFEKILNEYVKTEHVLIYKINYAALEANKSEGTFGIKYSKNDPAFAFIERGNVKLNNEYRTSSGFNNFFKDKIDFANGISSQTTKPDMYFISKSQLDDHIAKDANFSVVISRESCPDCSDILPNVIERHSSTHDYANKMYIFDTEEEGIYIPTEQGGGATWEQFKTDYKLADTASTAYGYLTGKVPTIQHYSNGQLNDSAMYVNNTITKDTTGEQVIYRNTVDFYTTARLTNLHYLDNVSLKDKVLQDAIFTKDQINEFEWEQVTYCSLKYEVAKEFYKPVINAYLDYYCVKA